MKPSLTNSPTASLPRRGFLKRVTLGLGGVCVAPYVRSQSKTAAAGHATVIGHGGFRYRVDTQWSRADPTKLPVKDCHEMVQVSDGRLFLVTNQPKNNVLIYDRNGAVQGAWTLGMSGAHGLTCHREADGREFLYVTDTNSGRVAKTTLEGEVVLELPHATKCGAYQASESYSPTETAVAPNGDVYVADGYGSQFILRYDRSGKFIGKFGGRSTQPTNPGRFMQAHGVALDMRGAEPLLVCTERIRNEFNWFSLDGKHVRGVYLPGAYVSRPVIAGDHLYSGVCFGAKPGDYRMWQKRGFVTLLDAADRVVSNPGGHSPEYRDGQLQLMLQAEPIFENCHDVCVDKQGDLYVCQWNSGGLYPYKLHREA